MLVGDAGVGWVDAEGGGERDEVVLLLHEDLANGLAESELVEFVALLDAAAILGDGFLLIFEIEPEHVFGLLGGFDRLRGDGGHAAEIVDVVGDGEGVGQLFGGVDGELVGDVHILRAFEDLGVVDVGNDGLIFASEVFIEELDELFPGDGLRLSGRFFLRHVLSVRGW